MGRRKRRTFTDEFKAEAVAQVLDRGLSVPQVATDLDLTETALRSWVKRAEASRTRVATGGLTDAERDELLRLRKEVKRLREDREILKSGHVLREGEAVKFAFIVEHAVLYGVARLCLLLGVSRSGFYAWVEREPSARAREDGRLLVLIRSIFNRSRGTYGAPRVHAELVEMGEAVSQKRVARLMAEDGLEGRSPRRRGRSTTKARPGVEGENVLDRQFEVDAPNRVWVADTTYLTTEDGPAFLVAILDLFSRRVVGWTVGAKLDTELAREALRRALALRQPSAGLLFHSDRGGEFTSTAFTADLERANARRSLSRPGECHDNAPAESFFGTLKDELDINHGRIFASPEDARSVIGEYIERFYNRQRRHSNNQYLSPVDFEAEARQLAQAA